MAHTHTSLQCPQELASFDQFSNMIVQDAVERRFHTASDSQKTFYCDIPLGVYVIRGDSVVLLGNVSNEVGNLQEISLEELQQMEDDQEQKNAATTTPESSGPLTWDFDADLIA
jgi:LSM domain